MPYAQHTIFWIAIQFTYKVSKVSKLHIVNPLKPSGIPAILRFTHKLFVAFKWFSDWTVIISLNNTNQLIFVMAMVCFLSGTDWILK
jgi:hypothetical protein